MSLQWKYINKKMWIREEMYHSLIRELIIKAHIPRGDLHIQTTN